MRKCENAKMRKCENAKMRKCENAKMRKCGNAKMRKRQDRPKVKQRRGETVPIRSSTVRLSLITVIPQLSDSHLTFLSLSLLSTHVTNIPGRDSTMDGPIGTSNDILDVDTLQTFHDLAKTNTNAGANADADATILMVQDDTGEDCNLPVNSIGKFLIRCGINLVLPFINGMMMGFGEIFAHEICFRNKWQFARVQPPYRMGSVSGAKANTGNSVLTR